MSASQVQRSLSVLLVEDSPEDAEILLHHLEEAGMRVSFLRVDTAEALARALTHGVWELVLSDYSLPHFNGLKALEQLKASGIDIPFILVSGTIGEDVAVTALKAGANDFITKGRLTRLVPAIERELREAEARRKQAQIEASLKDLQEKFTAIGEAASDAILMTDSMFRITFWNPAAERMFGYLSEEALGKDLFKLVLDTACKEPFHALVQRALHLEAKPFDGKALELTGRNRDGWEVLLEVSLSTVLLGGRWNVLAILRDITQRKAEEHGWREQLHFFETVLETVPNPLYYKDAECRYLGCNQAFLSALGLSRGELIGKMIQDISPADLAPPHQQADLQVLRERVPVTYEADIAFADSTLHTVIESKAPYFDIEGHVAGIVGTMLDITDRKRNELEKARLEFQLRQAQKLEAIGQLAAGIAHEINTPTQFIGDNTRFLHEAFRDLLPVVRDLHAAATSSENPRQAWADVDADYLLEEIPKAIAQNQDGIARITRIVGAMRDFSHPGMESKLHVDLNHSIESTLIVSHNAWKYIAEVETDYAPDLPPVPCFPSELNQVMLNLVVNAAHAIQEAKERAESDVQGRIRVATRREGAEVVITVEDNGSGIPEGIRERIFEPFFTTKPIGKGTGQGLAIAHAVITEKHKGTLTFTSELGKGSCFTIRLPLEDTPALG